MQFFVLSSDDSPVSSLEPNLFKSLENLENNRTPNFPKLLRTPKPSSPLAARRDLPSATACGQPNPPPPRNSECVDLISSYSVVSPLLSPGFHTSVAKPPQSPPPTAAKPPKPLPRSSLLAEKTDKEAADGGGEPPVPPVSLVCLCLLWP